MAIKDIFTKARYFDTAARREKLQSPEIVQKTKAVRHPARIRFAYCKTDAGSGDTITCYLDEYGIGIEKTIKCSLVTGENLNTCTPFLKEGKPIPVVCIDGEWCCIWPFEAYGICATCEELT